MNTINYKWIITLNYFNIVGISYSYTELMDILGMSIKQIFGIIESLSANDYLIQDEYIKITDKGTELLRQMGLDKIDITEIPEEKSIFTEEPMPFEKIYVPRKFLNKV